MRHDRDLNNEIISGVLWKFGERIIAQGVSFVISIVLARLLLPEEYGTISLVLIFITIANIFVSDGLGASLIQKKDSSEVDFSSVFFCSLGIAIVLYWILFLLAPAVSVFYGKQELTCILRVLAIQVPLSAIKTIQNAYVSKHMLFRKFFWSTLGGTIVSGVIGILMAYKGLGVWALVAQYLINSLIDTTILFITLKWHPRLIFCKESARELIRFSWKLLLAQLVNTIYTECRSLVIGKVYSEKDLAFTNKAGQFPALIISNINTSISSVLFPALSSVNESIDSVKMLTRKSMQMSCYIIFPMMTGMIVVAEPMISVLLTDKWLPCVPFLRLWCLYWMVQPCQTANVQAIKAIGRSDIFLRLEIIKKIVGFTLVFMTMNVSVNALILSNTLFAFISALINIFPNKRLIGYGYKEQLLDILPCFVLSAIMGGVVWLLSFLPACGIFLLVIQILAGFIIYVIGSKLLKIECYSYAKIQLRRLLSNK